jgi:hypothetical protein
MMMMMVIIMGLECKKGTDWGDQQDGGGGKEKVLESKENQSTLHIKGQHNKTHQTLFEKSVRRERS